jgi:DNA-binding NtrC family response regulator
MDSVQSATRESNSAVRRSVLVVDDEENLLLLLDRILSKEGYRVKTAPNSYQALHLLENGGFHVAILDIKMFPLDGLALLAEIKNRCPSIKVIMITAYPTVDSRNESFRKGATTYLTKPLDIQQLKSVIRTILPA